MTKAQFAQHLGINKSTVTRMHQAGRLVIAANGKVIVDESIAKINATKGARSDVSQRHDKERGHSIKNLNNGQNTQPQTQPQTEEAEEVEDLSATVETIGEDRAHYKALKMRYENNIYKLKEGINRGIVIEKPTFNQQLTQKAKTIKESLETLIDNLSPQFINATQEQRKQLIETEIKNIIANNASNTKEITHG